MWSSKERCGLDWVHFWDEISIEAWVKHANSDGNVSKIAAISDEKVRRNCTFIDGGTRTRG